MPSCAVTDQPPATHSEVVSMEQEEAIRSLLVAGFLLRDAAEQSEHPERMERAAALVELATLVLR
jgi:hypothetical protein